MKKQFVQLGDRLTSLPGIRQIFLRWTRNRVPIFLLHRAAQPEFGINGYDVGELMKFVDQLEEDGYSVVSLEHIVDMASAGESPTRPLVVFTADDGYFDQASVLGHAFAERKLPLTIFLITDFIDGKNWTWDAKVAFAFANTVQRSADIDIGNLKLHFDLSDSDRTTAARREYQLICKRLSVDELDSAIKSLCYNLEVSLPDSPPCQFAPLTWDEARSLESRGVTFGPHSCTHRVMSRMADNEIERELVESWERISEELVRPLKVIAWPIGQHHDFGDRELRVARSLGYRAAVAARHEVAILGGATDGFLIERLGFSLDDSGASSRALINGIRRLNSASPKRTGRRIGDRSALAGIVISARPKMRKRTRLHSLMSAAGLAVNMWKKPGRTARKRIRKVIFVCQGNICRSPYAAAVAQEMGISARSCGLEANNIASADEIGARIAFGRGLDMSGHISANIDTLSIGPGDLLLGMEPAHFKTLQLIAKRTGAVASLLGLWARPVRPWIEDPFGLDPSAFETVFRQIENAVDGLNADLPHLVEGSESLRV